MSPDGLLPELFTSHDDVPLDDVVTERDADGLLVGKVLGQAEGVGNSAFTFLVGIVDMFQPEVLPVSEKAEKLPCVLAARNYEDILDPCVDQGLQRIENHGPIEDRQQVFVGHTGEGIKPRAGASSQDHAFHPSEPPRA